MSAKRKETEFDRFKELTRKILKVPKSEIEGKPNVLGDMVCEARKHTIIHCPAIAA